jgi:hypothetical protein
MALIQTYDKSDRVRLGNHSTNTNTAPFTTVGGVATDPTAVVLTVRKPDGTVTAYTWPSPATLSKEATGRFYVDVTLDASGLWAYELAGTGAVQAVEQGRLYVRSRWVEGP